MNYDYSAGEQELREKVGSVFATGVPGIDGLLEKAAGAAELKEIVKSGYRLLAESYWKIAAGGKPPAFELAVAEIEASRHSLSFGLSILATRITAGAVASSGAGGWRQGVAERVRAGEFIGAVSAANPGENMLTVQEKPDGSVVLDGEVKGLLNGPIADLLLVRDRRGSRVFFVPAGSEGLEIGPDLPDAWLGGVRVDPDHIMALEEGKDPVSAALDLGLATACVGLSTRVFNGIKDYASSATLGGRPLMSDQHVRYKLAELLTQLQASEYLVYRTAWMMDAGDPEQPVLAKVAKVFCGENAGSIASSATLLAGTRGIERGSLFERAVRDAFYLEISGTNSADARANIADALAARFAA